MLAAPTQGGGPDPQKSQEGAGATQRTGGSQQALWPVSLTDTASSRFTPMRHAYTTHAHTTHARARTQ